MDTVYPLWAQTNEVCKSDQIIKVVSFRKYNGQHTGPDSLVDKASASRAGGRRFDSQCRRHWVRSDMAGW